MSFLDNMPSLDPNNFALLLSGEVAAGTSRQQVRLLPPIRVLVVAHYLWFTAVSWVLGGGQELFLHEVYQVKVLVIYCSQTMIPNTASSCPTDLTTDHCYLLLLHHTYPALELLVWDGCTACCLLNVREHA